MSAIEHIIYRHAYNTGFKDVSRFAKGTSLKDISSYVDRALRYGNVQKNGSNGYRVYYNTGKIIGTNKVDIPTSVIEVLVRDGKIQTAYPL